MLLLRTPPPFGPAARPPDTLQRVQGVIKSYDPATGDGSILTDTDLAEYGLADNALEGSIFRMLRQGQRVRFELDDDGLATGLHLGSEVDMGTPDFAGHAEPTPDIT